MKTYAWFLPDKIGSYFIQCAEFCGIGHSDMTAALRVVTEEDYALWLEQEAD
jgi:cytochrome c oxidase subunit 2